MRLTTRGASLALGMALFALPAQTQADLTDAWDQRYEGIEHLLRSGSDDSGAVQSYHIARIDLTHPSVYVRTALNHDEWGGGKEAVSAMAARHGAALAVNGDYWGWGYNDPSQGTTAVEGFCYRAHPDRSALALSADLTGTEIGRFGTWPIADPPPDDCPGWVHNAIGAGPQFIFDGVAMWNESANINDPSMVDINGDTWFGPEAWDWDDGRQPNTAVGITADGTTMILLTCDGRDAGGTDGCRMASDVVDIMTELGAHNALKLDSGGSTTFYYDAMVQNHPSDGAERLVADALIVQSVRLPCEVALDGGVTTIDDSSVCFSRTGQWWWPGVSGQQGQHTYTYAVVAPAADSEGRWSYQVTQAGPYAVEAFIPDADGLSQQAGYIFQTAAGEQTQVVDQQAARGTWIDLGTHELSADGDVRLGDNTGEPYGAGDDRQVAFDTLRFSWAGPTGGSGGAGGTGTGGAGATGGSAGAAAAGLPSGSDDGCGCRHAKGDGHAPGWLVALVLLGLLARQGNPERRLRSRWLR